MTKSEAITKAVDVFRQSVLKLTADEGMHPLIKMVTAIRYAHSLRDSIRRIKHGRITPVGGRVVSVNIDEPLKYPESLERITDVAVRRAEIEILADKLTGKYYG